MENNGSTVQVVLPADIVEALVRLGIRTEIGAAVMAGFRAGHPELRSSVKTMQITVNSDATIDLVDAPEEEGRR